ncbi:MAG TPA: DUF58 domain-containing protein [Ignavibacteriales bacterium]|nr:DUF58 domain-containing protein [Ignavibacteriales bacterium]
MRQSFEDYRKYLNPAIVSKLNSLELKARLVVEGFMVGLHQSPYHGFSAEFSQHRPYMQGDYLKDIDWKIYGKTDKYFIKQYEEETNLISHVVLDISKSMDYASGKNIRKLEYASTLAASLIYIMLRQQDAAGLTLYSDKIETSLPPKSSRPYLKQLLMQLSEVRASSGTRTADCLNRIAEKVKRKGLVVVISDFFDDADATLKALKNFRYQKNETIVFQILDPLELTFDFGADAIFKDMETAEEITTQPYQIQKAYQSAVKEFISKIKEECLRSNIEYNLIQTNETFDKALFSYFKKRSRLY